MDEVTTVESAPAAPSLPQGRAGVRDVFTVNASAEALRELGAAS